MFAYLVRRIAYGFLTVLGVLALLFVLFFARHATPDDIARKAVGETGAARGRTSSWIAEPRLRQADGWSTPTTDWSDHRRYRDTLLFEHYRRMLTFDFGKQRRRRHADLAGSILEGLVPQPRRSPCRCSCIGLVIGVSAGSLLRGVLPRDLHRPLRAWCSAVLAMSIAGPAVHHRRPVPGRHAAALVPDLRLRSRIRRVVHALPGPARAGRRESRPGSAPTSGFYRTIFIEETEPRLRADRPGQGLRRRPG